MRLKLIAVCVRLALEHPRLRELTISDLDAFRWRIQSEGAGP